MVLTGSMGIGRHIFIAQKIHPVAGKDNIHATQKDPYTVHNKWGAMANLLKAEWGSQCYIN